MIVKMVVCVFSVLSLFFSQCLLNIHYLHLKAQ